MGLYDRDYMRDDDPVYLRVRRDPWSPTFFLLVVLGVVFLWQSGLHYFHRSLWLEQHFALSLTGIREGRLWQLLTFQFLHGGLLHIALNGMTLYSFGRVMEQVIGRGRFLALYFLSGTLGGFLQVAVTFLLGASPDIWVVGASAGIAGLVGAFALMHPHQLILLFPIPFQIRARTMLWLALGISIIGTLLPFGGLAHAAHLGGLLGGIGYVKYLKRRALRSSGFQTRSVPPVLRTTTATPTANDDANDFVSREVDPILDKIATHGIHSLTERERKILESARARMGRR
jgi:membrane associated rhomboid family serine protease